MRPAFKKDGLFIADVRAALKEKRCAVWWLGQSGFLLTQNGRAIVLDPYLSDSLTKKYADTDKPHVRIVERVVAPEDLAALGVIDLITSSHNHTDHFDPETLTPLLRSNPKTRLIIPVANRQVAAERLGAEFAPQFIELDAGKSARAGAVEIFGIPAAHPTVERDESGSCRFLGYVVRWEKLTLYHSGDTLWHDGLVDSIRGFEVDIAFLPINGDRPERRVAGNLDGKGAARLAHDIGARLVIPCHFDMFEFNTASADEFTAECQRLGQPYKILENGEGYSLDLSLHKALSRDFPGRN